MSDLLRFTTRAYCKIILHVAKYPHCAVNGLLLCEANKGDNSKKGKVIVDVIPLFHICLHLSPMAEIALTQVDSMASSHGLAIAGYYIANESLNDLSIEKPATKIAEKINEIYSSALLVVVDSSRLTLTMDDPALLVMTNTDGKWDYMDLDSYVIESECTEAAAELLRRHADKYLIDFDNHLDDITKDWRNIHLNKEIESISSQCRKEWEDIYNVFLSTKKKNT